MIILNIILGKPNVSIKIKFIPILIRIVIIRAEKKENISFINSLKLLHLLSKTQILFVMYATTMAIGSAIALAFHPVILKQTSSKYETPQHTKVVTTPNIKYIICSLYFLNKSTKLFIFKGNK